MKFFVQWAIISNFFRADPIPLDPFRCSVLFSSYIEFPNGVYLFRGATIFLSQIKVRHFKLLLQAYEFNDNALSDFFTFYKQNNNKNVKKLGYSIWQSVAVKFITFRLTTFFYCCPNFLVWCLPWLYASSVKFFFTDFNVKCKILNSFVLSLYNVHCIRGFTKFGIKVA